MDNKEKKTLPNKTVENPKKIFHKIPTELLQVVINQLLNTTCKLSEGINLLNALKKAEIIEE